MSSGIVRPSPQFPELSNNVIVSLTWVSDISVGGGGGEKMEERNEGKRTWLSKKSFVLFNMAREGLLRLSYSLGCLVA